MPADAYLSADALLVDMPNEMMNDAKWHLKESERHALSNPIAQFSLWHEVRATVLFAYSAIESFINNVADEHMRKNLTLDSLTADYLSEKQSYLVDGELRTRRRLIPLDEKLGGWTKIITGMPFDKSDNVWQRFQKVKDFRDALVHYKPTNKLDVYSAATIDMAKQAVESAQSIIAMFYGCWSHPVPSWVTEPYRQIKSL